MDGRLYSFSFCMPSEFYQMQLPFQCVLYVYFGFAIKHWKMSGMRILLCFEWYCCRCEEWQSGQIETCKMLSLYFALQWYCRFLQGVKTGLSKVPVLYDRLTRCLGVIYLMRIVEAAENFSCRCTFLIQTLVLFAMIVIFCCSKLEQKNCFKKGERKGVFIYRGMVYNTGVFVMTL